MVIILTVGAEAATALLGQVLMRSGRCRCWATAAPVDGQIALAIAGASLKTTALPQKLIKP